MKTAHYFKTHGAAFVIISADLSPRGDRHTWNSFGWLFGMLLVRSFERSERIHAAMKCRGFSGRFYLVEAETSSPADLPFAAGFGALMVLLLVAKVVW